MDCIKFNLWAYHHILQAKFCDPYKTRNFKTKVWKTSIMDDIYIYFVIADTKI